MDIDNLVDKAVDIGIEKGWYNTNGQWLSLNHRRKAYELADE